MAKGYKTGGRAKGTPNQLTGTSKEIIGDIVQRELQKLPHLLDQMNPRDKVECTLKLLPYVLPKVAPAGGSMPRNNTPLHKLFEETTRNPIFQKN